MQSPSLSAEAETSPIGGLAVLVLSLYLAAGLISNVASNKIGVVFGLAVDMGTFLYPLSFTLRDLVHKAVGKRGAQALVLSSAAANLLLAAYLGWTATVPSDPSWGLGAQYAAVLSPSWRIVLASIAAATVAELVDTEVYQRILNRIGHAGRRQWLPVLGSNALSVPLDNLVFCLIAFAGNLPWDTVAQIFLLNLAVKFGMTVVSIPSIYLMPQGGRLHRALRRGFAK